MTIPFDFSMFAIAAAVVFGSYVVFGISAFGASLFTVPILSHFMPLDFVLPMCVLLDVSAALALGVRFSREADKSELKWMVPFCLAGAVAGVTLLVALPQRATIAGIGVFLVAYSLYSLRQGEATRFVSRAWAPVAGREAIEGRRRLRRGDGQYRATADAGFVDLNSARVAFQPRAPPIA